VSLRGRLAVLVSLAWIAPAILAALNEYAQQRFSGEADIDWRPSLFAGIDWLLYAFITPTILVISHRWPIGSRNRGSRIAFHILMSLVFCAVWAGLGTILRAMIMPDALWGGMGEHFVRWSFITLPFGVALYFAMIGVDRAIHFFVESSERELQMAKLAEQLAGAQLAALQAQVNPHFLFNTLNTISVLIKDVDTAGATRLLERLSDILRRTLSKDRGDEVTIEDELQLVRQYVAIEQTRFSDRLRVAFEVDEAAARAAVPAFAVQHLVENAIRHGVSRSPSASLVSMTVKRIGDTLSVAVADDGPGFEDGGRGPEGHGLDNTRARLRVLYGAAASLTVEKRHAGGTVATLLIPFRILDQGGGR
jgi:anti-sigma regulatory factor (Ser/Thr protein kinase)